VAGEAELQARAEAMSTTIRAGCPRPGGLSDLGDEVRVIRASAKVGGGALPLLELEGPVCAVDPGAVGADELARRLRTGEPPVVGRVREGWLLLDPRTLDDDGAGLAAAAVVGVFG